MYLLVVKEKVYVFTDATVNIDPSAEDLAEIAILAADEAKAFGLEPRVAMLSSRTLAARLIRSPTKCVKRSNWSAASVPT